MKWNQPSRDRQDNVHSGDLSQEFELFGAPQLDMQAIFKTALARGGDLAELYFEKTRSTRIGYENDKVDRIIDGTDMGVGVRVLFQNRSVYGYTSQVDQSSLEKLAGRLADSIENAGDSGWKEDVEWRFSEQTNDEIGEYEIKESPLSLSLEEKIGIAKRVSDSARGVLPESKQIMAMVLTSHRKFLLINSDGLLAPDEKVYFHMIGQVVGEKDGRTESAYDTDGGYVGLEFLEERTPESIGATAAERVKLLLDAKPAPSGTMPVVMSAEAGGTMIHEAVGHGLEADLACNGLSVYEGKIGQQVASPLVTVIDDGTMPGRRGSYALDDEGTPSKKNVLIENGILKNYMVDRISAMKFDLMATGNGRRESFRHKPIVRMTNTYIAPGKDDPDQILKDTEYGVFVKAMGGGQVNTVTGDFVFAVTEGYLIENGQLGAPIRGATLVGNGPQAMSIVDRVGTDLGFATGTCGKDGQGAPVTDAQPTIRIPELTVGGEVSLETYWPNRA